MWVLCLCANKEPQTLIRVLKSSTQIKLFWYNNLIWVKICKKFQYTGNHEDNVVGPEEALGPLAAQGDQREHQPLGVERDPAEKEGENNNS